MIGDDMLSTIATARWPAVVVTQRIDAGSLSNQRVATTPQVDHGTSTGTGTDSEVVQKGAQARSATGMCARSAQRCRINVKVRVSGK
jgi:hypothetical protein